MSEVLARIQVRETAGIRRFLYPLEAQVVLPSGTLTATLGLVDSDGLPVPCQLTTNTEDGSKYTLHFAVSLAPFEHREYLLAIGEKQGVLEDPMHLSTTEQNALCNTQKRFYVSLDWNGLFSEVIYDGITHLRQGLTITRNGQAGEANSCHAVSQGALLAGNVEAGGIYHSDLCRYETISSITACKSWVTITHRLENPKSHDEIVFTMPLAITSPTLASPTLTCDFGVGGYVFGKLDVNATEIVWQTEFGDQPFAKWTISTVGRVDYVGEVETAGEFLSQRWFHLIDSDKALAVAITKLPDECSAMTVKMTHSGDVTISLKLGATVSSPAEFGVCYHFLNDVPAIAAATNPQSILLPPLVSVSAQL